MEFVKDENYKKAHKEYLEFLDVNSDFPSGQMQIAIHHQVKNEINLAIEAYKKSISFEPQKFDDKGVEQLKRPKACDLSERDNPSWPVGYTYLDRFLDENKIAGGGSIVFVATTVKNYEVQAANFQELRRYIRELGEVIVYYKEVTTNTKKDNSTGGQPDNN